MGLTSPASLNKGFTLVELLVVVTVLTVLFVIGIGVLNPGVQLGKAKNGQRQHDLTQIQSALDAYYNDTGCYPTTLAFGSKWSSGTTVYMQEVPQDVDCNASHTSSCYRYETDFQASCPQWNVLFSELQKPVPQNVTCPLTTIPNCLPNAYDSNTDGNYCVLSGKVDCEYIASIPVPTGSPGGGGGGGGGGNPTPTPSTYPINCQGNYYACTGNPSNCNVEQPQGNCLGHGGQYQCYCTYSDCTTLSVCTQ